ncbi:Alb1-domain-containing protein [Morchella snyderi]|nr:Alb1-domain-containing protein [Morchella snyderi]
MGRINKPKQKAPSDRTRAARRQASPSLGLDKSLVTLPRASDDPVLTNKEATAKKVNDAVLRSTLGDSGIKKRKRGGKEASRRQKERMEKAVGKAEAVMERLDKKRGDSMKRGKVVKDRRDDWSVLNDKIEGEVEAVKGAAVNVVG